MPQLSGCICELLVLVVISGMWKSCMQTPEGYVTGKTRISVADPVKLSAQPSWHQWLFLVPSVE